jgi:hypothetical protein
MTSRIGKLLYETTGAARLADAQTLRSKDIALVVADTANPALVRSAVALGLRCLTGRLLLRPAPGARLPGALAAAAEEEAAEYDAGRRLRIGESGGELAVGLGCPATDVFVDAYGWTVSVNSLAPAPLEATAPAAAFAVAAGFAKLFARLIGRDAGVLAESWSSTMLDLPLGPANSGSIDVGRVVVIGAGARQPRMGRSRSLRRAQSRNHPAHLATHGDAPGAEGRDACGVATITAPRRRGTLGTDHRRTRAAVGTRRRDRVRRRQRRNAPLPRRCRRPRAFQRRRRRLAR